MEFSRANKAKLNIVVSLICQFITLACGLVVPRLMIGAFGSEAYGATTSIAQFLAYISLLEGGIGGVARAALYKPLANKDMAQVSNVVYEIKKFFRIIAFVFAAYVLVLACSYKSISHIEYFDWLSTFMLVIVISLSTFAQYFIGISYSVLLQAAQKTYITQATSIFAAILNTIAVVILVNLKCSLIVVKLVSSCVFILRPIALWIYVKTHYKLPKCEEKNGKYLEQKWSGLGQHIAFFLHSNTDIAVLTILKGLTSVAVYSVYNMVISQIQNLTSSFSTGMEALFGDMLAKNEKDTLHKTFSYYETLISIISTTLFSVTVVMIIPFVRLYTAEVHDVNYIEPIFAILLVLASLIYCLRIPYHSVVIAAGHFRQTRTAAYGEAVVNIVLSIALAVRLGLAGVAAGTVVATLFRLIYYVYYLSKNIVRRKIKYFVKRTAVNLIAFLIVSIVGMIVLKLGYIDNYIRWAFFGVIMFAVAAVIILIMNLLFYNSDMHFLMRKVSLKGGEHTDAKRR